MKNTAVSTGAAVVLVAAGSEEQATQIAHTLVSERLAACANIVSPIRSVYRWNDEVQTDTEHLLIIKTRANLVAKVAARVKELHSYEVLEVIALPILAGAKSYLDWLFSSTMVKPSPANTPRRVARGKK
jgi:periplasmic divalent cation tolerance protein